MTIKEASQPECPCIEQNQCVVCQDLHVIPQNNMEVLRLKAIDNRLQNQRTLLTEKLASVEVAIELNQRLLEELQK